MKYSRQQCVFLALLAVTGALAAQTKPEPADQPEDKLLHLSPFLVTGSAARAGRYTDFESTSAGRIRTDLMDSIQSVSVITAEVLQDVAGRRLVEATRYVAGITDSSLPTAWDRTNLRGFLADGRTVDGFTSGAYPLYGVMNLDPAVVERIEVVKGPSSILAPQPTSPGGTINHATKKPQFRDFGVINLQVGRFSANSGGIDVNRVVGDRLAVRLVASVRDWDEYWQDAYVRSTTVMPGLTYRFSDSAQVTVQYLFTDWQASNYFGLPIDPASGTTTASRLLDGVRRDLNVYPDEIVRTDRQHDLKLLFTAEMWHGIQLRLAAVYHRSTASLPQLNIGPSTGGAGGSYDPVTGLWNSGLSYGATPPYAASPLPTQPTRIFSRSGLAANFAPHDWQVQNDYAYLLETDTCQSTTLVGFACANAPGYDITVHNLSAPNFDIDHYINTPATTGSLVSDFHYSNRFRQAYVMENLALFKKRLILNLSHSWQAYDRRTRDLVSGASAQNTPHTALPSFGLVLKPRGETVSLYYSHTEQSSAISASTTSVVPSLSTSQQDEFGARFKGWDGRLYLTVAHYVIVQDNFGIPNPANFTSPPPNPPRPPLYLDRTAQGWEYELRANPTKNLSIIGSYTHFKNRDPNHVELRGVAEKAGGLLASYAFDREHTPALAGFRVAVGIDYLGRRPGDTPSSVFTVASTPTQPIPTQPSFYLGARTLVNLTLAYEFKHSWAVQVNVDNLLDREYLMAANLRTAVFPGPPRNIRVGVRYGF